MFSFFCLDGRVRGEMFLILTLFGILSSLLVSPIVALLLTRVFVNGDLDKAKNEMLALKKELQQISAQDEFAKWAKLKRKSESLSKEYSTLNGVHSVYSSMISWGLMIFAKTAFVIILWRYWNYPVFTVNESLLGVFTPWLAWPFSPKGSVSPFYVVSSASFVFWKLLSCVEYN